MGTAGLEEPGGEKQVQAVLDRRKDDRGRGYGGRFRGVIIAARFRSRGVAVGGSASNVYWSWSAVRSMSNESPSNTRICSTRRPRCALSTSAPSRRRSPETLISVARAIIPNGSPGCVEPVGLLAPGRCVGLERLNVREGARTDCAGDAQGRGERRMGYARRRRAGGTFPGAAG